MFLKYLKNGRLIYGTIAATILGGALAACNPVHITQSLVIVNHTGRCITVVFNDAPETDASKTFPSRSICGTDQVFESLQAIQNRGEERDFVFKVMDSDTGEVLKDVNGTRLESQVFHFPGEKQVYTIGNEKDAGSQAEFEAYYMETSAGG